MFKDEILENKRRREIFVAVDANPGFHLRRLQRVLNMPLTTLHYHLSYMTRKRIIFAESEGHQKKYYTKRMDVEDKRILSALRQKRMRHIVLIVLANKKTKYKVLADHLKLPRSTLSFYLKHLVDKNILTREKIGHENVYILRDQDRVKKVLAAYKPSFTHRPAKTQA
jgi:predicted transcriptional regulator